MREVPLHSAPARADPSLPAGRFFFFITLKPRVERYTKSMSLKCEPASEPQEPNRRPSAQQCVVTLANMNGKPEPCTLHPAPCTLHPKRYTLNAEPHTLNPKALTLGKPEIAEGVAPSIDLYAGCSTSTKCWCLCSLAFIICTRTCCFTHLIWERWRCWGRGREGGDLDERRGGDR